MLFPDIDTYLFAKCVSLLLLLPDKLILRLKKEIRYISHLSVNVILRWYTLKPVINALNMSKNKESIINMARPH